MRGVRALERLEVVWTETGQGVGLVSCYGLAGGARKAGDGELSANSKMDGPDEGVEREAMSVRTQSLGNDPALSF